MVNELRYEDSFQIISILHNMIIFKDIQVLSHGKISYSTQMAFSFSISIQFELKFSNYFQVLQEMSTNKRKIFLGKVSII